MDILNYVVNTLNTIKVSGKDDLQKLLGCILALESLLNVKDTEEENNG